MSHRRDPPKGYRHAHCSWCGCAAYLPTTAAATATFKCDECEMHTGNLATRREALYQAALSEVVPFMVRARQADDVGAEDWLADHRGVLWLMSQRR